MKVRNLIATLSKLPLDMEVLVDGYEGGFDNINSTFKEKVKSGDEAACWGQYDESSEGQEVLILSRHK